jgi:ATP-dependent RNA helicase SUPV3L1/SUV3
VLGLPTPELHLTGEESAYGLVERMLRDTRDRLTKLHYDRLSELRITSPVQDANDLRPGDCIIAFSRKRCHELKTLINQGERKNQCAIIYGSLPPDTRREQAAKFNTDDGKSALPILVATDAVGMGLNYNISRVIFYEMRKNDGYRVR